MKDFLKKLWEWIKKSAKFLWDKFTAFISKFSWTLKLIKKGIVDSNVKNDKVWVLTPTIFSHMLGKTTEIGLVWFGVGFKLVITPKG